MTPLLANSGGSLPQEVVLMIIEKLDYHPTLPGILMRVSREFKALIQNNEGSLSTHFAGPFKPLFTTLCASGLKLHHSRLQPRTFPWLAETYLRDFVMKDFLMIEFGSMSRKLYRNETICGKCFDKATEENGIFALNLLYQVFDAEDHEASRFESQKKYINGLSMVDLAHLRQVIECMGLTYAGTIVDYSIPEEYDTSMARITRVIREMVLRQGPYFVFAGLQGSLPERVLVKRRIGEGLVQVRELQNATPRYEFNISPNSEAYNLTTDSLHKCIVEEFCRKRKCRTTEFKARVSQVAIEDFAEFQKSFTTCPRAGLIAAKAVF